MSTRHEKLIFRLLPLIAAFLIGAFIRDQRSSPLFLRFHAPEHVSNLANIV